MAKNCDFLINPYLLILALFFDDVTQRYFSFYIPGEMVGSIDFLFVRSLFLGMRPSKNTKKNVLISIVSLPKRLRIQSIDLGFYF